MTGRTLSLKNPEKERTDENLSIFNHEFSDMPNIDFLKTVKETNVPVYLFLVNGVKLQGVITHFDKYTICLFYNKSTQLVYKSAISTILPALLD